MKNGIRIGASILAMAAATPVFAQSADDDSNFGEIVVTAQRQSERLQDVPIAVSAFSAEMLEAQQIENASDLQLTLPNVTFTKGQFTGSSFTIRGVGDLCVGNSCDSATGIHVNGSPLFSTRLFETEYFDLERVEVLRGPQGTLYGRNATSGVVNFITAKPKLGRFEASVDGEYGNYDSKKIKGMVNVPLGEHVAFRGAGFYLKRDGYSHNIYDNGHIDDREMYAVRGSLRFEIGPDTTLDLMGYYFREKDSRMRVQTARCQRDPTGVLGCLNNYLGTELYNANAAFPQVLGSREVFALNGISPALGLGTGSLYGSDANTAVTFPTDVRETYTPFTPRYFTDEIQAQAHLEHNFGAIKLGLTGIYQRTRVDSLQGTASSRDVIQPGLNALAYYAANGIPTGAPPPYPAFLTAAKPYFAPIVAALIPDGPDGKLCTSAATPDGLGVFGGNAICSMDPLAFDRSMNRVESWSTEAIFSSDFDGPFNFLIGGIYADSKLSGDYYVNAFSIDYFSALFGSMGTLGATLANPDPEAPPVAPAFLGPSFYNSNTESFHLRSYGIFGEAYVEVNDRLKLTVGLRYNNDRKHDVSNGFLANFLIPYGTTGDIFNSPYSAAFDADTGVNGLPGAQRFRDRTFSFDEVTGRFVIDYKITDNNLVYASYSRGYKSGGINPALQFNIPGIGETFKPEIVDAFEIGSKNSFGNGALQLNLTGFYYKYKGLQLSRIAARTSINDNINADIYGFEAEAVVRPDRDWLINLGFSYLKTKVADDLYYINQRDPSGGLKDSVIIKDVGQAFNCAVVANTGGQAFANAFVTGVNTLINAEKGLAPATDPETKGLRGPEVFPANANLGAGSGAFSSCAVLEAAAKETGGAITVYGGGVPVNIKGNQLPQAPNFKFSAGVQHTVNFDGGMSLVPRLDLTYTGESYGNIFNGRVNKIKGYAQANAAIQLNGDRGRWYVRGFIQNIFDNNATTGLFLADQSAGLVTNIFTLEPRRYGIGAGVKF